MTWATKTPTSGKLQAELGLQITALVKKIRFTNLIRFAPVYLPPLSPLTGTEIPFDRSDRPILVDYNVGFHNWEKNKKSLWLMKKAWIYPHFYSSWTISQKTTEISFDVLLPANLITPERRDEFSEPR